MTPSIEQLASDMETALLVNIAEALQGGSTGKYEWYTQKLADLGKLNAKNRATIQIYIEQLGAAIDEEMRASLLSHLDSVDSVYAQAGVTQSVNNNTIFALIDAYVKSSAGVANYTGENMLGVSRQAYIDIITTAQNEVLSGTKSTRQAVKDVLKKWADKGLIMPGNDTGLIDKGGRTWQADSYVSMQIRTASTAAYRELTTARNEQYGNDLIEISSHLGARPGCAPYQGKVYSQFGKNPRFPAFSTTTFGEAAGLFGVNCRHIMYPFIEGASTQRYNPIDEARNAESYKLSQQQRKLERDIRKAKRDVLVLDKLGEDTTEASAKVRAKQQAMRDFIEETGRTRLRDREQI